MAGFDLSSIVQEATNLLGMQTQLGNQQVGMLNSAQQQTNQIAGMQEEAGRLNTFAKYTEQLGELETQQANLAAAQAAGTDIGATSDILTPLLISLRSQAQAVSEAQAKVSEIEANSDLINNPLGWLRDLVQGDSARSQLSAAAAQFDTTAKQIQNLNQVTQTSVATQNAIKTTLTAESVDATAQAMALEAKLNADLTRLKGMDYGIQGLQVMRELGNENFRTMVQTYGMLTEEARYQEGRELRKLQMEEARAVRQARMDQEAIDTEQIAAANVYLSSIGKPPLTPMQYKARVNQNNEVGATLRDHINLGYKLQETKGIVGVFGEDAWETRNRLLRDKPELPATYSVTDKILKETNDAFNAAVAAKLQSVDKDMAEDPEWLRQTFNDLAKTTAERYAKNIQPGTNNPYQIPNISTILSDNAALAQTPFAEKVLRPLAATGKDEVDSAAILAVTSKMVASGELQMSEAVKAYTEFFATGTNLRNATGGFMALSLPTNEKYVSSVDALQPTFIQRTGAAKYLPVLAAASAPQTILRGGEDVRRAVGMLDDDGQPDLGTWYEAGDYKASINHADPKDVTLAVTVMMGKGLYQEVLDQNNKVGE